MRSADLSKSTTRVPAPVPTRSRVSLQADVVKVSRENLCIEKYIRPQQANGQTQNANYLLRCIRRGATPAKSQGVELVCVAMVTLTFAQYKYSPGRQRSIWMQRKSLLRSCHVSSKQREWSYCRLKAHSRIYEHPAKSRTFCTRWSST